MSRLLFVIGIMAVLSACNGGGDTDANNSTNTTDHSAHTSSTSDTVTGTQNNTASVSGQSMMGIMQRNMDQMKSMQSIGSSDKDFAAMMKTHHMGALEMAQLEVAQGKDEQLKQMAQQMIDEQQKEITQLDAFLSTTNQIKDSAVGGKAFYQQAIGQMNNMKMDMNHSGSIDHQFAQMMIPHHQGGIDMAKLYLKSGAQDQKLKTIANVIITDQQKEINDLQAWLNKSK